MGSVADMEDDLERLPPREEETRKAEQAIDILIKSASRAADVLGNRWVERAACAKEGLNPDDWFPDRSRDPKAVEAARICFEECPVRLTCLESACLNHQLYGIYGGIGGTTRKVNRHDYKVLSKITKRYR
ncbi:WhiB family transcriptional regulator [Streptomyces sp. LARHCF252]